METLPKALADEIECLEELDARALKRKYPALLSDAGDCSASGILRSIVAYRLQEKHYGRPLAEDAKSWLEADDGGDAPDVFATTLECRSGVLDTFNRKCYKKQCFFLNKEQDAGKRIKRMLASAAIPWGFDAVEIDGRRYIDGGWEAMGGDNIPVAPIFRRHPGIRTIIVVRCNCAADEPERIDKSVAEGVEIV